MHKRAVEIIKILQKINDILSNSESHGFPATYEFYFIDWKKIVGLSPTGRRSSKQKK